MSELPDLSYEGIEKLQSDWRNLKEYIFVLDIVDDHMVPVVVAHATLTAHRNFEDLPMYKHWLRESYKKCVCKVNIKELDKILELRDVSVSTERNYGSTIIAAVVCPRLEYPNVIKYAKLWKPNYEIRSSLVQPDERRVKAKDC